MTPALRLSVLLPALALLGAAASPPAPACERCATRPIVLPPIDPPFDPPAAAPPVVQVAILLDTSNSMDGLIAQAKTQLWGIVGRIGAAKREGRPVQLQVALFEYGNTRLPAEEGYLRQVLPFTTDLDRVSQALFALTTSGGDEYCGQVIGEAVKRLPWSAGDGYKAIYIAGNEPFTQGESPYQETIAAARGRGIVVNTIHCGGREQGVAGRWQDGAQLGRGRFFCINQDCAAPVYRSPYDDRILELNQRLNATYIPYGAEGVAGQARQLAADSGAAAAAPSVAAERACAKAQGATNQNAYYNGGWDLVDAVRDGKVKLADVSEADLPADLRKLGAGERAAKVAEAQNSRLAIQKEILDLSAKRAKEQAEAEAKAAEEKKAKGEAADTSFGAAMREALDEQMKAGGYSR